MKAGVWQPLSQMNFLQWFSAIGGYGDGKRIHVYDRAVEDSEYVIEPLPAAGEYLMTSQKAGVKAGDYILLNAKSDQQHYQVMEVDFYDGGAFDLWTAKLTKVPGL